MKKEPVRVPFFFPGLSYCPCRYHDYVQNNHSRDTGGGGDPVGGGGGGGGEAPPKDPPFCDPGEPIITRRGLRNL